MTQALSNGRGVVRPIYRQVWTGPSLIPRRKPPTQQAKQGDFPASMHHSSRQTTALIMYQVTSLVKRTGCGAIHSTDLAAIFSLHQALTNSQGDSEPGFKCVAPQRACTYLSRETDHTYTTGCLTDTVFKKHLNTGKWTTLFLTGYLNCILLKCKVSPKCSQVSCIGMRTHRMCLTLLSSEMAQRLLYNIELRLPQQASLSPGNAAARDKTEYPASK